MCKGFTLLELLISTTISTLLLLVIPPSLQKLIAQSECEYTAYSIQNALSSARNHAVAINERVIACMADDNNNCSNSNFSHLLFFVDKNIDNKLTLSSQVDSDILLFSYSFTFSSVLISSNRQEYVFQADGSIAGTPGTIRICNQINSKDNIKIIIAMSGRVRRKIDEQC